MHRRGERAGRAARRRSAGEALWWRRKAARHEPPRLTSRSPTHVGPPATSPLAHDVTVVVTSAPTRPYPRPPRPQSNPSARAPRPPITTRAARVSPAPAPRPHLGGHSPPPLSHSSQAARAMKRGGRECNPPGGRESSSWVVIIIITTKFKNKQKQINYNLKIASIRPAIEATIERSTLHTRGLSLRHFCFFRKRDPRRVKSSLY